MKKIFSQDHILHFRYADQNDVLPLYNLINRAFRGEESTKNWTSEFHLLGGLRTSEAELAEIVSSPNCKIVMGYDVSGVLIGCVTVARQADNECHIGMMTVDPSLQARGYGRQLLEQAEIVAKLEFGATKTNMSVVSVRHELVAWYERRGYRKTGEMEPFPDGGGIWQLKVPSLEMYVLEKNI